MNPRRQVRNRLLGITRNIIPHVRELRAVAGSISAAVVMQQLDYWFIRYPDGFYKFLEPTPNAPLYRPGQSWCEELCFSKDEFRTAFDRIGCRWPSKSRFDIAPDKFLDKFYASYVDRRTNLTFYFRNHELVDLTLDRLLEIGNPDLQEIRNPNLQGVEKANSGKSGKPISGNRQSRFRGIGNPDILYTETTTETKEITPELLQGGLSAAGTSCSSAFHFPANLNANERDSILKLLAGLDAVIAQNIIDEVAGTRMNGKVRQSVVSLASGLVKRAREGNFNPAVAWEIAGRRKRDQQVLAERKEDTRCSVSNSPAVQKPSKKHWLKCEAC